MKGMLLFCGGSCTRGDGLMVTCGNVEDFVGSTQLLGSSVTAGKSACHATFVNLGTLQKFSRSVFHGWEYSLVKHD